MLEVKEIDVHYGPVQATRGITLSVGEGEMVALLGANGAGKTTTLRAISGMLNPTRGSILIDGKPVHELPPQKVVRLGVAHVPEGRELFSELTVTENLRLGHWSRRSEKERFDERLQRVFELFPRLKERAQQAAGTMSGGEQQMLVAARALMSEPKVLLVDELSMGLAPMIVSQLFDAVKEVNRRGTAVLLVEQFVHLALQNTARAYVLAKGEVVAEGKSAELLSSPELMSAYLGDHGATEEAAGHAPKAQQNGHHDTAAGAKFTRTGEGRDRSERNLPKTTKGESP